jgi:hypothetical protein
MTLLLEDKLDEEEEITQEACMKKGRVRLDQKNRIALTRFLPDWEVDSFNITVEDSGRIILEPMSEIPSQELWLYQNPDAYQSVKRGLKQSAQGKTSSRGSFAKYVDEI